MKNKKTMYHRLRYLFLTALLVSAISVAAGCSPKPDKAKEESRSAAQEQNAKEGEESTTSPETIVFTDSIGREVTIPAKIEKIAPAGNPSQMMLYSLAPDMLVGLSAQPGDAMMAYYPEDIKSLPVFGVFYGKKANLNKEALIAAQPQLIIDIGEVKKNMKEDLDDLQEQLNIPVIFVEAKLENTGEAYRTLGKILGREDEAEALAQYCDAAYKDATEKASSIPEDKKVKVYYGEGQDALAANPKGSFHTEVIDLVGGINAADIEDKGKGNNQVSLEQIVGWNPDVVLLTSDGFFDTIGTDAGWQEINAVKNNMYFEIPSVPYNWIDKPPAVNRFIGIKWLGNLLYPDIYSYDMVKEAKEYYKLFYRYDLSDEEAARLLEKASRR